MKWSSVFISIGIVFSIVCVIWRSIEPKKKTMISIGTAVFIVEKALTDSEKERGLGYRDRMPDNEGMLFVYDNPGVYHYWMKGMRFPLDFVWIREEKVVDLTQQVPVAMDGYLPNYKPKEPVTMVLELNAGQITKNAIKIGDAVHFTK